MIHLYMPLRSPRISGVRTRMEGARRNSKGNKRIGGPSSDAVLVILLEGILLYSSEIIQG